MTVHITHKSLSREQFLITKKIKSIPSNLLDYNVSVLDYCADNFESISHITSIQEREIKSQYFFTKNKDSVANETSFKGLQLMSKIQFESIDSSVIEEKTENEYEGLVVFRDVPPKNKSVEKSEGFTLKSPYDSCIDACIDAQNNTKAWIISTIEKRGSFSLPSFPSSIKWIWIIHLLNIFLWVGEILGLFYVLKNEWNIIEERYYRDSEYFSAAQTLTEFIQNNNVRLGFFILAFLVVGGILVLAMMWRAKRKIRSDFNLKNRATQIAETKEETLQFLASVITALIANYLEGLFDLELDVPRYIYVLDELQKLVPLRNFDVKRFIVSYLEIARAHRVTIIGIGQDPDEIAKVFRQAGFIVDFGTHSTTMDKTVFEKDHLRAPEEKEHLAPEQMCFVKLHGERRVLLKVADFDTTKAIDESRLMDVLQDMVSSQLIRANYQLVPISIEDLEGKAGKQRLRKKDLLVVCQQNCDNGHCNGFVFNKYKLPKKSIADLKEFIEKEEFIEFCYRETEYKKDLPCVIIHYLGFLLDRNALSFSFAQRILEEGISYMQRQHGFEGRRERIREKMTEEPYESPYGFDSEDVREETNFDVEEFDYEWE